MSYVKDVDLVLKCVKNISDNCRCVVCDSLGDNYVRFPCGHISCGDCAIASETCTLCLTPPHANLETPNVDTPLTLRAENAAALVNACQILYKINVDRRQRLSEKLKAEKEVFPECIQAPNKYSNKRKCLKTYINKENQLPTLPGEAILSNKDFKMENSIHYVQQWLIRNNKKMKRQPFADLNSNNQRLAVSNSLNNKKSSNAPSKIAKRQKLLRKHLHIENRSNVLNYSDADENFLSQTHFQYKKQKKSKEATNVITSIQKDNDNDESGIVIDDDNSSTIVIDDSQSIIDKDHNAWLAVIQAAENEHDSASITRLENSQSILDDTLFKSNDISDDAARDTTKNNVKVPFYKRDYMFKTCMYCSETVKPNALSIKNSSQCSDVHMTIENQSFATTIRVSKIQPQIVGNICKNSRSVQTDISDVHDNTKTNEPMPHSSDFLSLDLFTEVNNLTNKRSIDENYSIVKKPKVVIIDESDSDENSVDGGPIEVTADIHFPNIRSENNVLGEIKNLNEHTKRKRRSPRGVTPTSTDSSEKENFNPNRVKKMKVLKKKYIKK